MDLNFGNVGDIYNLPRYFRKLEIRQEKGDFWKYLIPRNLFFQCDFQIILSNLPVDDMAKP